MADPDLNNSLAGQAIQLLQPLPVTNILSLPVETPQSKIPYAEALPVKSVKQGLEDGIPPIEWLIHNLLTTNGVAIVASPPKEFKTFLAIHAATCIATGSPFLERFNTTQGTVLYIDEENSERVLLRRFKQMLDGQNMSAPDNIKYVSFAMLKLDTLGGIAKIQALIREHQPSLVILDSMVRFMSGDEDKATDVRIVFENLRTIMSENTVSFLILHHTRKGGHGGKRTKTLDDLRGSSDFGAFADCILGVETTNTGIIFRVMANRHVGLMETAPQDIEVRSDRQQGPITLINHGVQQSRKTRAKVVLMEWLRSINKKEFTSAEAIEYLKTKDFSKNAYYEAIKELTEDGEVAEHRHGVYMLQIGSYATITEMDGNGGGS